MIFTRIFDLIYFQQNRFPGKGNFNQKILGRWESRSTDQFIHQMNRLSAGLLSLDIKKGDHIGIITTHGSTDWFVIDLACQQVGCISIPIHPQCTDEELSLILDETGLVLCFTNEDLLADRLIMSGLEKSRIISFGNSIRHKSWNDILPIIQDQHLANIHRISSQVSEDDIATIIYTSGSTGQPKGVMLSHKNIVSNIKATIALIPVSYRHKVASFLPLSHIFERMVVYTYMGVGAQIYFIDNMSELVREVRQVKPDYITSVPRILEKIHNEIRLKLKKKSKFVRATVRWALKTGEKEPSSFFRKIGHSIKLQIADILVYSRWRKILGGRIKGIIVGAAAMPPAIARLYSQAGIPIKEGYGLTETSPVISFNRFEPGGTRFGTVGIPIPGIKVKIDDADENGQGEIKVRGPNVMKGYFKKPELTSERIDDNGWFATGDIGKIVHGRFLKITDRKKNIYKSSSGKYIYPQRIEDALRSVESIDQCMMIGFHKPFNVALIIPEFSYLKRWCKEHNIHWTAELYVVENDRVVAFYEEVIAGVNKELQAHERIQKFRLLSKEWSVEDKEYTSTLKLRRDFIESKYKKDIDKLYQ